VAPSPFSPIFLNLRNRYVQLRLIFHEPFATREEALAAEREIKGWSREKKWALARRDWQVLKGLSVRRTPRR